MTEAMWRIAAVPRMPRLFLPALVLVVFCAPGRPRGNFGGINAIELMPGGGYTGYADPRRTNAAAGY